MTPSGGGPLHALTLGDVLRQHRHARPGHTAAVCGDRRLSYAELDERVNRLAGALRAAGFGPGDRLLWMGQNCHRVLEGLLAAANLGGIFCPANWRLSADELRFVIDDAAPRVVIWQETEIGEAVRAARAASASEALWLRHDAEGEGTYEAFLGTGAPGDPDVDVDPASPALMFYTAAFGGRPNGALLPHAGLIAQAVVMGMVEEVTAAYVYLNCGPLFHIATFMMTLATLQFGGTNVFVRRIQAEELCRIIERERCTGAYVLGPVADQIVELNRDGRYDLRSLRVTTGTPAFDAMTSPNASRWSRRPGGYGQTETGGLLTFRCLADAPPQGSHGWPSPAARVRIVGPNGIELPAGEVGEIVVRSPTVMVGYWNRPELNARRQAGGWHHTNDLGRLEPDGSLTFIGPITRIVKSASENIYPAEVEACIAEHPAVAEAAVIGVPDPVWVQSVEAIVVLAQGRTAAPEEIIEHCRTRIASYKKPRFVEFVDALPRTAAGAVDYEALDAAFGGGGYPGPHSVPGGKDATDARSGVGGRD